MGVNTIDIVLISFIGLFAVWGFIRGVVSQAMSIVALVAVYFFSTPLSKHIVAKAADFLGSSSAYAKPFAVLWSAIMIFIACKLMGFLIERLLVDQSESLKSLNRIGGGFLGIVKGLCVLVIAFYILLLVPQESLKAKAPKISESKIYQFISAHQLLDPKYIETVVEPITKPTTDFIHENLQHNVPQSVTNPANQKKIEKTENDMNDKELQEVLGKHAQIPPSKKTIQKAPLKKK